MKNTRTFIPALLAAAFTGADLAAQDPAPASPDKPAAVTAPAEAPAVPKTEMQKWIEATDAQWQTAFKKGVTDVHEADLNKVKLQYLNVLEGAIDKASKASDLKAALALRDEQKRFGDTQHFPEQDDAADAASVKQARAMIREPLAKVNADRATRAKALHAKYDQTLAQAQAQLTQAKHLDDAQLVQAKRDEVAAAWITPVIAAVAEKPAPPAKAPMSAQPAPAVSTPPAAGLANAHASISNALTQGKWTWYDRSDSAAATLTFHRDGKISASRNSWERWEAVDSKKFKVFNPAGKYWVFEFVAGRNEARTTQEGSLSESRVMKRVGR